jgi:hypothetical protein
MGFLAIAYGFFKNPRGTLPGIAALVVVIAIAVILIRRGH